LFGLFHFESFALCIRFAGCLAVAAADIYILSRAVTVLVVNALFSFTANVHLRVGDRAAAAVLRTAGAVLLFKIGTAGLFVAAGTFAADHDVRAAAAVITVVAAVADRALQFCHCHTPLLFWVWQ
jgi:pyridoxal biosynthesis lyase PdxS